MAVNQDLTHELSISEIETATRFHGGLAATGSGGRPAGAGNRAYNSHRRPARMPEVPSPYPEDNRDVEDVDRM
jgi:hypothetical protein